MHQRGVWSAQLMKQHEATLLEEVKGGQLFTKDHQTHHPDSLPSSPTILKKEKKKKGKTANLNCLRKENTHHCRVSVVIRDERMHLCFGEAFRIVRARSCVCVHVWVKGGDWNLTHCQRCFCESGVGYWRPPPPDRYEAVSRRIAPFTECHLFSAAFYKRRSTREQKQAAAAAEEDTFSHSLSLTDMQQLLWWGRADTQQNQFIGYPLLMLAWECVRTRVYMSAC